MHPDIGVLNSGKCYVFLDGCGPYKEPFYGTQAECEAAIAKRDAVSLPTAEDTIDTPASPARIQAKSLKTVMREYIVVFQASEVMYAGSCVIGDSEERVWARDRNEALMMAREMVRENVGRYGPKYKITAKLAK